MGNPLEKNSLGIDFKIKTLKVDGKWVKLQLWDTAGQERWRAVTNAYYRDKDGIMIVYDVTNENSFNNIKKWMEDVEHLAKLDVVKIIVATKTDLEDKRVISKARGQSFAMKYKV